MTFQEEIHILIPGMLPYMAVFADAIKFKILRWGDYPGLSVSVQNAIKCTLLRVRQKEI